MRKFFKGLLALILITIIISGLGYIGYSNYFFRYNSMNMTPSTVNTMNPEQQHTNAMIVNTVEDILANKQNLESAISAFTRSLDRMTLDPYGSASDERQVSNPENHNTMTMSNMGTTYDVNKMEQLHKGLYKLSIGMHKLEKLNENLLEQAEEVKAYNMQDQVEFYSNQYVLILQNRSKLNDALNNIKAASNMANINPYILNNGIIYDKDRMMSIHESIFVMAEGVSLLEQLNDELVKQAIDTSIVVQNALNESNMLAMPNHTEQTNEAISTEILGSLDFSKTLKLALAASIVLFVYGLLGAILSLFKTPQQNIRQ